MADGFDSGSVMLSANFGYSQPLCGSARTPLFGGGLPPPGAPMPLGSGFPIFNLSAPAAGGAPRSVPLGNFSSDSESDEEDIMEVDGPGFTPHSGIPEPKSKVRRQKTAITGRGLLGLYNTGILTAITPLGSFSSAKMTAITPLGSFSSAKMTTLTPLGLYFSEKMS